MATSDPVRPAPPAADVPGPTPAGPRSRLSRGSMGTFELTFFVVAAAGPLLIVAGYAPLAFLIGGLGAPGAQLVAALVLLLFAVGFTRMALRIRNPGAFYSYIGRSLGRPMGGGAAMLALGAYSVIAVGQLGAIGAFASSTVTALTGADVPWPVFSLAAILIVVVLGHRQISLSAKVLGGALLAEVAILLILAVPVLLQGGPEGFSFGSFAPSAVFAGGGTGAMFAIVFGAFIGFESTAIYAEETRDPARTVPRATFLAIGFLGIFYTFMAWIAVIAFGQSEVVAAASADPVGLFFTATEQYVGHWATVVMEVLLVTSAFASTLAFHNTASRYFFTLGREGLLPRRLAAVHPVHGSPYVASGVQATIAVLVVVVFAAFGADPYLSLFLLMVAPGVLAVIVLQALCAVAIVVYFRRHAGEGDMSIWATLVAPLASLVGLLVATWLVVINFDLLTGRTDWVNVLLLACLPVTFAAGVVVTRAIRRRDPGRYQFLTQTQIY
ncbi:APC family permease [Geodermatophilus sabuli]|uniref:Amino acid/polyamine/organocation transporter, APC superfamily n=1 Tax=Geodermatophilus sabuli TaxID=1564158 RepID=A0A285EFH0_9ACTN|nr:APC family permease [Geodermatophilus sabuli]MBB3086621.1 amino acid transporter [Geodermatophilus sabuli]SNX97727.1 amino acid/polyamine/organocation transporter, APC superfamily [Geodermatophilus sabuli]